MSRLQTMVQWQSADRPQFFQGYAFGARYPSLVLTLRGREISQQTRTALWGELLQACPALVAQQAPDAPAESDWPQSVTWLLSVWQLLQQAQGMAVCETGRIMALEPSRVRCLVPVSQGSQQAVARLVHATVGWLALAGELRDVQAAAQADLLQATRALSAFATKGSNVPRFVKAAYDMGLPMTQLPGAIFQYGLGSRARRLDSSFTDVTPTIAAKLSRNKAWASAWLEQAGLPVAPHFGVKDAAEAVLAAHRLGYPVVVKPADLDGGIGVAAGLQADDEVRQAFEAARKLSKNILVEKHVFGKDYRLTVFQGKVIWAIERIPGGVQGDGCSSVVELVQQLNADPRRGTGTHAPLKRLQLDEEAQGLLMQQGLTESAVPAQGQFVRLRRTANVASGGQPVAVFDKVHPDNARLAVRAAELMGLDLAGIDLLINDVACSWRDSSSDAVICEVNGQPNLGQTTAAHLYAQILERLVPGDGRVPIVLVLGAEQSDLWLDAISSALHEQGLRVGVAGPEGVSVAGELIYQGPAAFHHAGRMLVLNRQVDAMVLAIGEDSVLTTGLPWERYDALVLAGSQMPPSRLLAQMSPRDMARQWLRHLLPACDGVIVAHHASGLKVTGIEKLTSARWCDVEGDAGKIARQLVQGELTDRHRRESR